MNQVQPVVHSANTLPWGQRLIGAAVRRWLAFRYRVLSRRYGRLVLEEINGVPLIVLPEVFNPVLLRTGEFLAHTVMGLGSLKGQTVLDMGTGSGVGAIFAARQGASITAVDINPEAVRCARLNALLNRLEDRVEVLSGDLFAPLNGRQFDLVLFNPPYHRGRPKGGIDHAWRGEDVFERFAAGLGDMLRPGGRALLILSSDGNCDELIAFLQNHQFKTVIIGRKNLLNELLTLHEVKRNEP
jgi:HemK-related putative methylase